MKTRCMALAAIAVLVGAWTAAHADTVDGPHTFNYPPTPQFGDPKNIAVTLPKFNSMGGARLLKRVDIDVSVSAFLSTSIENNLAGPRSVTPSITGGTTVDFPTGLFQEFEAFNVVLPQANLAGTDGVPCSGPDFFDYGDRDLGPLMFDQTFLGNPATLSDFIGPGNLTGSISVTIVGDAGAAAFSFQLEGPRQGGPACQNTSPLIQATASVTYYYSDAPGSCCLLGGSCVVVASSLCTEQQGTPGAPGTTCSGVVCPQACCLPTGACVVLLPASCTAQGGIPQGVGPTCATTVCDGRCCLPNGECVVTTSSDCSLRTGFFAGIGTVCSPANVCGGACCLPNGTCIDQVTAAVCNSQQGVFRGPQTNCGTVTCGECVCYWENGEADGQNAVLSHTNVTQPDSEAADDFVIPAGKQLIINEICGCMVTNDLEVQNGNKLDTPDAVLFLYDDCNGKPGTHLATFVDPSYEIGANAPFGMAGQYKYVRFCFDLNEYILSTQGSGDKRFWLSLVGVGDNQPGEVYFWATSRTAPLSLIQGVQAQLRSAWIEGFADWRDVDDSCCAGCHDLCFDVCGDLCDVVIDNGPYALDCGLKILNTTSFGTKTADNFEIGSCFIAELCYAELYIATNCEPTRSRLELWTNECNTPAELLRQFQNPEVIVELNGTTPVTFSSPVSGNPLQVYRLRWRFNHGQVVLPGGRNYWIATYVDGSGLATDEAYFLCRPLSDCHIRITQAKFLAGSFTVNEWEDIGTVLPMPRDAAFRVFGKLMQDDRYPATAGDQPAPWTRGAADTTKVVPGDVNGDGVVDARDLLEITTLIGAGR